MNEPAKTNPLPKNHSGTQPHEQRVQLQAKLNGTPKLWLCALSDAGFTAVRLHSNALELSAVQSLDLHGQPHEFIRINLSPRQIILSYTLLPSQRPARRQLEAARLLLLTLSSLPATAPPPALCAWLSTSLQSALDSLSEGSEQLLHQNEQLAETNAALRARVESQGAAQEATARQLLAQAQSIEAMQARLERLSSLPDSVLDDEVMEWLVSHDGQIRLREVAALHQVPPARIEESLDRLSKAGRIARSQN